MVSTSNDFGQLSTLITESFIATQISNIFMSEVDFSELTKKSLDRTDELIQKYGPRLAGTNSCHKVGEELAHTLSNFCDKSQIENFAVHPDSFSFYIRFLATMYFLGGILLYLKSYWVIIPFIGLIVGIIMMISIFGVYSHFFDRFFPKKVGKNLFGHIDPSEDVRQQIILSGHHDSAREIRILASRFQKYYVLALFIPYCFFLYALIVIIIALIGNFAITSSIVILCGFILSIPFMLVLFFALNKEGTPGAGDNLISSVLVIELGKYLASLKQQKHHYLKHTRIILTSFDAEEAGLRGAAAFMKTHQKDFHKIPTYHLNLDSLYNLDEFHILTHDINGSLPLSSDMVEDVITIGKNHGITFNRFSMTFGGGGTDAAESARIGIPSTTILAMPTNLVREGMVYHTRYDTVDSIEPKVIEACFKIAWDYVWQKDKESENLPSI